MTTPQTMKTDPAQADALRVELVEKIIAQRAELNNAVLSSEVEVALRTVPRHLFAPGVPLEKAYANDTVITKRDEHGVSISSVSAPWLQAMMLEQAQIRPGMRSLRWDQAATTRHWCATRRHYFRVGMGDPHRCLVAAG